MLLPCFKYPDHTFLAKSFETFNVNQNGSYEANEAFRNK
jgi:hypothetical protein